MILHKFCSSMVWYNESKCRSTILSSFNSLVYLSTVCKKKWNILSWVLNLSTLIFNNLQHFKSDFCGLVHLHNCYINQNSNKGKLTIWKSAKDLFLLAWATNFIASMSEPLYFKANFPLTIFWTSSGLQQKI